MDRKRTTYHDTDVETQQILEWLDSPAGKAATAAAANESRSSSRYNRHKSNQSMQRYVPVPSPLTKDKSRSHDRLPHKMESVIKEDSLAMELLEQERRPLKAIFDFYASKRKMIMVVPTSKSRGQHRSQAKAKPTMFMVDKDFNRFCFDFNIVPGMFAFILFFAVNAFFCLSLP